MKDFVEIENPRVAQDLSREFQTIIPAFHHVIRRPSESICRVQSFITADQLLESNSSYAY